MNENTCICPFVKSRVSAGTRKRRSKKGDLSCRIDCYSYMARFGTKHAGQAISRAYGKSNSLFLVKFCYILPACLTKNRLYTFKIVHLNAVITLCNNKQNKYSNSIYKIYLKPCHDHCILPTYFPEEVGQLSREFLDQSNRAIFYASWLRFLFRKFTQDGKNL